MPVVVRRASDPAVVLSDEFVALYVANRAEPPYRSAAMYAPEAYRERTLRQVGAAGFTAVEARDGARLVGFGFGLPFTPGRWWAGAAPAPPQILAAEKFAVIELNTAAPYRGRGIGRRMLDELLADRRGWATLIANPAAPAHAMYLRWGWRPVGTLTFPDGRVQDILALPLRPAR